MLLIALQLGGGTPLQRSLDQIERSVMNPVPQAPPTAVWRPTGVWVPDRYVSDPVDGRAVLVPGHWERVLPGGETYAPALTTCGEATGACAVVTAGVRPHPDTRRTP